MSDAKDFLRKHYADGEVIVKISKEGAVIEWALVGRGVWRGEGCAVCITDDGEFKVTIGGHREHWLLDSLPKAKEFAEGFIKQKAERDRKLDEPGTFYVLSPAIQHHNSIREALNFISKNGLRGCVVVAPVEIP